VLGSGSLGVVDDDGTIGGTITEYKSNCRLYGVFTMFEM
jgi:hypothetical protein